MRLSGWQFGHAIVVRLGLALGTVAVGIVVLMMLGTHRGLGLAYLSFFVLLPLLVIASIVSVIGPTVRRLRDLGLPVFWAGVLVLQLLAFFVPPLHSWVFAATSAASVLFLIMMPGKTGGLDIHIRLQDVRGLVAAVAATFFGVSAGFKIVLFIGLLLAIPLDFLTQLALVFGVLSHLQTPMLIGLLAAFTSIVWKHRSAAA